MEALEEVHGVYKVRLTPTTHQPNGVFLHSRVRKVMMENFCMQLL